MDILLSTGETVSVIDTLTHRIDRAFWELYEEQKKKTGSDEMTLAAIYRVYDAYYPTIITKIQKDGQDVAFSVQWLDDLARDDYALIYRAATDLNAGTLQKKQEAKKNSEAA